jgi:hypothetical protein
VGGDVEARRDRTLGNPIGCEATGARRRARHEVIDMGGGSAGLSFGASSQGDVREDGNREKL